MKKLKKIISTILITVILISNTQSLVLYANENTNNIIEIEDVNSNLNVIRKTDKKEKTIDTIKPELISIEVDKKEVKVGEEIEVTVEAKDEGGSGIKKVSVYYSSPITYKTRSISLKMDTDGKYRGKLKLTDQDESGEWLIYYVSIYDNVDNYISVYSSNNPNVFNPLYKEDLSYCNFKLTERSNEKPVIAAEDVTIKVGDTFDPMSGVTATDKEDGDITSRIEVVENTVNTTKAGTYTVKYSVKDSQGATATKTIKVTVKEIYKGWVNIDFSWYFYDNNGVMVTGWLNDNGTWYYMYLSGRKATGWIYYNGKRYYLDNNGVMLTGWQKYNTEWYYLDYSGAMITGWLNYNGKWYYLDDSGVMLTGWLNYNGKRYYLDDSGAMLTGWQYITEKLHYLDWYYSGKWYYLDDSGAMITGWLNYNGKRYYLDDSGAMLTHWQYISGKRYYLDDYGVMLTGWLKYDGKWYYLDDSGAMLTGWLNYYGTWYYMSISGEMITDVMISDNGKKYYLDGSGAMLTGWLNYYGKWYYMYSSGSMATNTIIDGWKIDSNGVATPM